MTQSASGITTVLVAGAGTMGQEIAADCIHRGFDVRLYDTNPQALVNAAQTKRLLSEQRDQDPKWTARREEILSSLHIQSDLAAAAQDVDLVIECIPERLKLKQQFFREVSRVCPASAILVTNSSILLPSQMASEVQFPERFAALHFLNECRVLEVMAHPGTNPDVMRRLELFSRQIGRRPITIPVENVGHVLNAILIPINYASLSLAANGVASIEDVDRTFMMTFGTTFGPFGNLDAIGLDTALEISKLRAALSNDPQLQRNIDFLSKYVSQGRLGVKTKAGFYDYPDPSYRQPGFTSVDLLPGPASDTENAAPTSRRLPALLEVAATNQPGVFVVQLDPQRDGFWRDHVMKGTPLLPAASLIEMVAEAARILRPGLPVKLEQLSFVNGIRSFNGSPQTLFIEFQGDQFSVFQEFRNQAGKLIDPRRLCASGRLGTGSPLPTAPTQPPAGRLVHVTFGEEGPHRLGPTMRAVYRLMLQEREGMGEITAVPMTAVCPDRADREFVHSIPLIDGAFFSCSLFTEHTLNGAWQIPLTIASLQLGRGPRDGERCEVRFQAVRLSETDPETEYVMNVFGSNGDCLMSVAGYRCHVMKTDERTSIRMQFEDEVAEVVAV